MHFPGLFVATSSTSESRVKIWKPTSYTATLGAVCLISTIDFGSKITGCKPKHNDAMEVYANLIINTDYVVRTVYSLSVYLYMPYDYVCLLKKQVLFYLFVI